MIESVDPFIGTDVTDLPAATGLAATWWWPKPQIGNTHPGATSPFGMVSACAYSGAYPTGYGRYLMSTEGVPPRMYDGLQASGFTHFQQSGTGAIRKYYNYFRVTPMIEPLDALDTLWPLDDEVAEPGYYAATLGSGIRSELTVGPKSAVHRYTFPSHQDSRLVVDFSLGGLATDHGRTVPMRARLCTVAPGVAQGEIVVEGVPLAVHMECDAVRWRQALWYDRRLMAGGSRLEFDAIRLTTLRPFGLVLIGPTDSGEQVELRMGFSLRGVEQAKANLYADCGDDASQLRRPALPDPGRLARPARRDRGRGRVERAAHGLRDEPLPLADQALLRAGREPVLVDVEVVRVRHRDDVGHLQDAAPADHRAGAGAGRRAGVGAAVGAGGGGQLPDRLPHGPGRGPLLPPGQRAGPHVLRRRLRARAARGRLGVRARAPARRPAPDLRRGLPREGRRPPVTHTLDLAYGYHCTARVARHVGDHELADHLDGLATRWVNAFDPETGLLIDSEYYEGGRWNYSFRLLHDMAARVQLAGGAESFVAMLDRFFGFGQPPVKQLTEPPYEHDLAAGYALGRFEGLNNEPDMEAPWAYHYAGRPDRTTEVVRAVLDNAFGVGRGGLPGNDDSGGLSSWYVWASLGLFPVAGQSLFLLHAPSFDRSSLRVSGGEMVIETEGRRATDPGDPPQHVRSVRLDGQPLERSWLTGRELHRGGHSWSSSDPPRRPGAAGHRRSGPSGPMP